MRKLLILFAVLIASMLVITSFGKANAGRVLVNIWDGTEWTKIRQLFHDGLLRSAESVGPLFQLTCNIPPLSPCNCNNCNMETSTKPQHATMLTGFLADVHGVFRNKCYQLIPDGLTVYEQIEDLDKTIKTAHISSKPGNFGELTFGNIIEDVDYFVAKRMPPKAAADIAIELIDLWSEEDFFIVCHFKKPDVTGHEYGVDNKKYKNAILWCNRHLGRILSKLTEKGILQDTKIYVLSDHGFGTLGANGHSYAPNTFVISNDVNMTNIYMDEVAGFLLSNFGL